MKMHGINDNMLMREKEQQQKQKEIERRERWGQSGRERRPRKIACLKSNATDAF